MVSEEPPKVPSSRELPATPSGELQLAGALKIAVTTSNRGEGTTEQIEAEVQEQLATIITAEQHRNTRVILHAEQRVIVVTADRMLILLQQHRRKIEQRWSWSTPAGIVLTLLLTFTTTTFQAFVVSADTWRGVCLVLLALSIVWLLYTLRYVFVSSSLEQVVDQLCDEMEQLRKRTGSG